MEFLAAENENRQLKDLPQAVFGRVLERVLLFFTSFFRRKPFATTRFDYQINEVHFKLSYVWSKITSNRDKIRL